LPRAAARLRTDWFQGWSGLKNGALLKEAESTGFDLFITADQEIAWQQNLKGRKLAILVLSTNNRDVIQLQIAEIVKAIDVITPGCCNELHISSPH
jgi:hypothetical protein